MSFYLTGQVISGCANIWKNVWSRGSAILYRGISVLEQVQGVSLSKKMKNSIPASMICTSSEVIHLISQPKGSIQAYVPSISMSSLMRRASADSQLSCWQSYMTPLRSPFLTSYFEIDGYLLQFFGHFGEGFDQYGMDDGDDLEMGQAGAYLFLYLLCLLCLLLLCCGDVLDE